MKIRWMTIVAGMMGLGVFGLTACGDDTMTGPQFGDLQFTPSFVDIQSGRSVTLSIGNTSSTELGPIAIGVDNIFLSTNVNEFCDGVIAAISPTTIQSLGPGEERDIDVQFDTSGATATTCTPGKQEALLAAAVDDQILAFGSILFDWDDTSP